MVQADRVIYSSFFSSQSRSSPRLQEVVRPPLSEFWHLQAFFWQLAGIGVDAGAHHGPEAFLA